jgi:DNA adenine methylase
MFKNKSPLRYPGGKTRACKIIDEIIKEHFDLKQFDTLVSPFFGGGSFEFYFQNKYGYKLIVNDKFTPLYNFWQQVKTDKNVLCSELEKITTVSKENFAAYRSSILQLDNPLQQAIQYFIINRCSFSGATLSGGFSEEASQKRYTPSSIARIGALDLSAIDIYNLDFQEFIAQQGKHSILFLDPPYYLHKKSKLYGNNGDMHENFDHEKLFALLKEQKNWLMTYNNCAYIKNMYKDYIILEVDWTYGMNATKASSEIIIIAKAL